MNETHMQPVDTETVLEAIEGQSHTPRYGTMLTLQPRQSVAEHIGRCVQIMVMVCKELQGNNMFPPEAAAYALTLIATHDIGESLTGDVIGPTKKHVKEFQEYEDSVIEKFGPFLYSQVSLPSKLCWMIHRLVYLVDTAEGAMYCTEERQLGNYRVQDCLRTYKNNLYKVLRQVESEWGEKLTCINIIHKKAEHAFARGI